MNVALVKSSSVPKKRYVGLKMQNGPIQTSRSFYCAIWTTEMAKTVLQNRIFTSINNVITNRFRIKTPNIKKMMQPNTDSVFLSPCSAKSSMNTKAGQAPGSQAAAVVNREDGVCDEGGMGV